MRKNKSSTIQKPKTPNDQLIELRKKISSMEQILKQVNIIEDDLIWLISSYQKELEKLEKRVCPTCNLIHSPYSSKHH